MAIKSFVFRFDDIEVREREFSLTKAGTVLAVEPKAFRVLLFLLRNPQRLVSKEELLNAVWGDVAVGDGSLTRSIFLLRRLLGDETRNSRYIETVATVGYRFVCPVQVSEDPSAMPGPLVPVPDPGLPPHTPLWKRRLWQAAGAVIALALIGGLGMAWHLRQRDYFWKNPLDGAKIQRLTDFDGDEFDAAISPDGKFAIFSSDRSGQPEVWLTQIGSGEFANITTASVPPLIFNNGTLRALGFSGDGSQVWFSKWVVELPGKRRTWIGPAIGGVFRTFLDVGMEPAWSPDGSRIVYHSPEAGDAIYIADRNGNNPTLIFVEKPAIHCHFPTWSPDNRFIYFVKGTPSTEETDIWRIPASSRGEIPVPERITHHNARVGYLSWLDSQTLIYSAAAEDGSGQWLYSIDVERRVPHRVSSGLEDQYLAVSVSDKSPRRLVASVGRPSATLWTVPISDRIEGEASAVRFPVSNTRALGPRIGSGYLLFLSGRGSGDGLWRLENGSARELWKGSDGALVAAPAIDPGNEQICFTYRKEGRASLHIMSADGTNVRVLAPSLDVRGGVSWSPDGKWVAVGADRGDGTHLFKVPVDGGEPVQLLDTLSYNPVWSPDGKLIVFSEQQAGGEFVVKAVTPDKSPVPLPAISVIYTKGTSYRFLPGQYALIVLEGDFRKQVFFRVDLGTGEQRALTDLQPGFRVQDFDVSLDGKRIVFDRLRDNADVILMELSK